MSANLSSPYAGAPSTGRSGLARTAMAVFGGAAVLLGIFLLFNPFAAVRTLALLLGLALVVSGVMEIALGWESGKRNSSLVLGAILVVGGLLAAFWPEVTVWTLALLTGVSLVLHGIGRIAVALMARSEIPAWGWLALAGVLNVVAGVVALVWPEVTVLVLSFILGLQVLAFGVCLLVVAFAGSRSGAPRTA
jgi:uncharacterized membrane protein HdeD (DUF308 family)